MSCQSCCGDPGPQSIRSQVMLLDVKAIARAVNLVNSARPARPVKNVQPRLAVLMEVEAWLRREADAMGGPGGAALGWAANRLREGRNDG